MARKARKSVKRKKYSSAEKAAYYFGAGVAAERFGIRDPVFFF